MTSVLAYWVVFAFVVGGVFAATVGRQWWLRRGEPRRPQVGDWRVSLRGERRHGSDRRSGPRRTNDRRSPPQS